MDLKTFLTTFAAVFVAELGDKTQLATVGLSSERAARLSVFLGAAAALVVSSAVAVAAGALLDRAMPGRVLKLLAGGLFLVLGALMLLEGLRRW